MSKNFFDKCYNLISKIPKGKVTTYKEVATALNSKGYRAVGNAMNKNPNAPIVPCHRVVASTGKIGGYAFGTKKKIELLRKEGIKIEEGRIQDLKKYLVSSKELKRR